LEVPVLISTHLLLLIFLQPGDNLMTFAGQLAPKGNSRRCGWDAESIDIQDRILDDEKVGQFMYTQYAWSMIFFESRVYSISWLRVYKKR